MFTPLKSTSCIGLLQFPLLEGILWVCKTFVLLESPGKKPTLPEGLIFDALSQLTVSGIRFLLVEIQTKMK
jgi:hypothetical protein